jgi:hypothetical protein
MWGRGGKSVSLQLFMGGEPKQAGETAVECSIGQAARSAVDRGWGVDASLSVRDEGLSACRQRYIGQRALSVSLRAVADNEVPADSVRKPKGRIVPAGPGRRRLGPIQSRYVQMA